MERGRRHQDLRGAMGEWSPEYDQGNVPTAEGESFSRLIASLGGPPGKAEG